MEKVTNFDAGPALRTRLRHTALPTTVGILPEQFWVGGWGWVDGSRKNTTTAASLYVVVVALVLWIRFFRGCNAYDISGQKNET